MVAASMRPLLLSRPVQIGLAVVVAAMGALGFVPLFGGAGYESSLGAGLVLAFSVPAVAALAVAAEVAPLATMGGAPPSPPPQAIDLLSRGLSIGALFALTAWVTTLVH